MFLFNSVSQRKNFAGSNTCRSLKQQIHYLLLNNATWHEQNHQVTEVKLCRIHRYNRKINFIRSRLLKNITSQSAHVFHHNIIPPPPNNLTGLLIMSWSRWKPILVQKVGSLRLVHDKLIYNVMNRRIPWTATNFRGRMLASQESPCSMEQVIHKHKGVSLFHITFTDFIH